MSRVATRQLLELSPSEAARYVLQQDHWNVPEQILEALTTAAAAAYTLTLTNTVVAATDKVLASVQNGTNTQGIPVVGRVTPGSGSVVILVYNLHASEALNGTIKVAFLVVK